MSFPNIPDIDPEISVTFEDAVNLLLTSIAMEEISLSKLMDAETQKILHIINDCKHKESVLHDAIKINKSVDDTLKNMIKLQMLLQFKLDNVKEILPTTSTTTTTSTSTSTTSTCTKTTTHTTTCTTSTHSTTTEQCCCSLTGTAKGHVSNRCDAFCGQMAVLYVFLYCCDINNRTIRYSVGKEDCCLRFWATGFNVSVQWPTECSGQVIIYGKGRVKKESPCTDHFGTANFVLTIDTRTNGVCGFQMEIKSNSSPEFNHNSGFVETKATICNLR